MQQKKSYRDLKRENDKLRQNFRKAAMLAKLMISALYEEKPDHEFLNTENEFITRKQVEIAKNYVLTGQYQAFKKRAGVDSAADQERRRKANTFWKKLKRILRGDS